MKVKSLSRVAGRVQIGQRTKVDVGRPVWPFARDDGLDEGGGHRERKECI